MNRNFEAKATIVRAGESRVFKSWQALVPTLTENGFVDALEWLCADPLDEQGRLTREIGLAKSGIVLLDRYHDERGITTISHRDTGKPWEGDCFRADCSNPWLADADGKTLANLKLSLSCRDRV